MRARQLILAAAAAGLALASGLAGQAPPRAVSDIERELLLLLQGADPIAAHGSPALCPGQQSRVERGGREWYFGDGSCRLSYPPSLTSVVTTASEGELADRLASPETRARLVALLRELRSGVPRLSLQQRLMIHSAAWEIAYGLRRTETNALRELPELQPALCESLRLLKSTHFTVERAAQLPSTLADLPRLAAAPEIARDVAAILGEGKGIVEVVPSTDLHADLLFGRFLARVFLTLADAAAAPRLIDYLQDPARRYEEFRELPSVFPGVQAILVLYFNVLDPNGRIVPTEQVAAWQQYAFAGSLGRSMPFAEAGRRISFLNIEFERSLTGKDELRYRKADQQAPARQGLLDVKPWRPGLILTTKRGQCLACHSHQVATFDTHGVRLVDFTPPLERPSREIKTAYYRETVEAKLQQWAATCKEPAPGGAAATEADPRSRRDHDD